MKNPTKELMAIPPEDWLEEADRRERAGDKQGAKTAREFAHFLMGRKDAFENPRGVYTTYSAWRAAAKKAGAVRFEGDKDIAQAFDDNGRGVAEWDGAEGQIYRKSEMQNPRGVYTTYSAWRAAAKKAGAVRFEGDKDIAQAFDDNGRGVAEWDGSEGQIYRKSANNPAHRPKESPLYVKYLSLMKGEEPFMMQGTKYEYVWAEYPGGIKDIGVYSYAGDLVYSYDSFRKMMNLDRTNPVHSRNPRQRIGISLSKNRRRNPVYDTGSDE